MASSLEIAFEPIYPLEASIPQKIEAIAVKVYGADSADRLHRARARHPPVHRAGWLVALCGDMQTMPGLGKHPAAFDIDIAPGHTTVGLF